MLHRNVTQVPARDVVFGGLGSLVDKNDEIGISARYVHVSYHEDFLGKAADESKLGELLRELRRLDRFTQKGVTPPSSSHFWSNDKLLI